MVEPQVPDPYVHRIQVRYGEVDMQRVVFNAHYLAYCDDACERWMADCGVEVLAHGWDFMLKKVVIEWAGAAGVNDQLDMTVRASRWGNTSFDLDFRGEVGCRSVFSSTITYVGVRAGTLETMPPPGAVRALLGG